ncbi:Retrovirus-related Pol polyprotein from transposon RE1 [Vitis vinifera]|uniref:Retrovirus-related Pol polyprotein from transposon RE1 n=1 Tax=Vitis vinifera TaxID=29760 RepID=A0A438K920_VITVI|nr:Retrovirus-related Pol polyprotein from transposon RE1 [Vitis vinifera]
MELKFWIFCRYGSPTTINHPKTSPNIDKLTFKCTHYNKTDPTSLDVHNFKATTLGMTRKTMRNRGFEPWTFRSCLGYHHFVINDNNRDQWKKDSKKTLTATVAEIKTKTNVAEKASALVAATDHGDKFLDTFTPIISSAWIIDSGATDHMTFDFRQVSPLRPSSQKIVSTTNGNTTPVIGEGSLTLTDTLNLNSVLVVPSLDYNLLMTWLCLVKIKDEVNLLFQKFHKMIETQYNAKVRVLRSDNGEEYQSSDLQKYLEEHDIIHRTTCSNTPQQNGVAEWKNWHLLEFGEYHKEIQTLEYDYHISEEDESGQSELVNQEAAIPNSVQEALVDPRWKAAMNEEMKSLQKNETWELVECPSGKKLVGCRWIYTVKYKVDGSIEQFKARLVAKWYTQTYGIDYTETFAPVVKINTVRVLLSLAANLDWPLQQFDDKMPFCMASYLKKYIWIFHQDAWCQKSNVKKRLELCVEPNQVSTDKGRYQRLVGRLMYLAHTRPDLAYALSVSAPGKGILFTKNVDHQSIEVYTDADWAGAVDDRRSTSGYFTFVGGNLVTWKRKKQNVVACSSAERNLEHVEVDRFFIKEKLDDKIVELPKIRSENQLVDILTKAVSSQVFSKFLDKLGMCDIYAPT